MVGEGEMEVPLLVQNEAVSFFLVVYGVPLDMLGFVLLVPLLTQPLVDQEQGFVERGVESEFVGGEVGDGESRVDVD